MFASPSQDCRRGSASATYPPVSRHWGLKPQCQTSTGFRNGFEIHMRTHNNEFGHNMSVKMWYVEELHDRTVSRHDMVHLSLNTLDGSTQVTGFADRGFPVLQPYVATVSLDANLRQQIIQMQDNSSEAGIAAEAIAVAVLSELMNVEMTVAKGDRADSEQTGILEEFQEFLVASRSGQDTPFPAVPEARPMTLGLSRSVANAGLEMGIFRKSAKVGTISNNLLIRLNNEISGFQAVVDMQADREEHGIQLPAGFDKLCIESAKRALKAVRFPLASTICAYGDATHPGHSKRIQAADAYPLFAEYFVQNPDLLETIDNSGQLRPLLTARTKLGPGKLRRLGKLETPPPSERLFEFGETVRGENQVGVNRNRSRSIRGDMQLSTALDLLCSLATNWVPDTEREWTSLADIASACALPLKSAFGMPVQEVLATSKGNWSEFKKTLAVAAQIPESEFDRRQMALCTIDALDAVDEFSQTVVLPLVLRSIIDAGERTPYPNHEDFEEARQLSFMFLTRKTKNVAGALFSLTRRWISRIPALIEAEERTGADLAGVTADNSRRANEWPALADDFNASNELVVQNLISAEQLKEESFRLKHCVGRLYLRKAKQGRCHIFSVRDRNRPLSYSTIELSPPDTCVEQLARSEIDIIQHKGESNRRPSENAQAACAEWLKEIRTGHLKLNLKEVLDWRATVKSREALSESSGRGESSDTAWDNALGTQWRDAAVQSATWVEWREHILGRSCGRVQTPEVIYRLDEAQDFLFRLNPQAGAAAFERPINPQSEVPT